MRTAMRNSHGNHHAVRHTLPQSKKAYVKLLKLRALANAYKAIPKKHLIATTYKSMKRHPMVSIGATLATIGAGLYLWYKLIK